MGYRGYQPTKSPQVDLYLEALAFCSSQLPANPLHIPLLFHGDKQCWDASRQASGPHP